MKNDFIYLNNKTLFKRTRNPGKKVNVRSGLINKRVEGLFDVNC